MQNLKRTSAARQRWMGALVGATLATALAGAAGAAPDKSPQQILKERCGACHLEGERLQRISALRKSPEGWDMTIARMGVWHKVEVSKEERRALVKYLADTQGLAPSESAPYRFLMERVPNAQDVLPGEELGQMCGRCHSFGRAALQRRTADEWLKLIHTHLGQFPSIEYSALGRDRNWREIALDKTAADLAARYPLDTEAWKRWRTRKPASVAGTWRVAGHRPGWGDYAGYMTVKALGSDRYDVSYELNYEAGNKVSGRGESVVYTGYEWRGDARLGNQPVRSVFALSEDGKRLEGRWYQRNADEIGASFQAVRGDVPAGTVLTATPGMVKAGTENRVTLHGVKLGERFEGGPGITVLSAERHGADEVSLRLKVDADATVGAHTLKAVGGAGQAAVAVYRQIDSLRVEPAFGIARLGGGTNPPVTAQFEAVAYANGPDGQPGTADDIRLGVVPADWQVDAFDDKARHDEDPRYAGAIDPKGLFTPSFAGPNPARGGLNNVGNLSVNARAADGDRSLSASGQLMVTVQRWNLPPLR